MRQRYGSTRTVRDIDPRQRQWAASTCRGTWREPGRRTAVVERQHVGAPARTSPPKLRDAILAYPTMAAGPGSLFSDVPSYRRCEATMADLSGGDRDGPVQGPSISSFIGCATTRERERLPRSTGSVRFRTC